MAGVMEIQTSRSNPMVVRTGDTSPYEELAKRRIEQTAFMKADSMNTVDRIL